MAVHLRTVPSRVSFVDKRMNVLQFLLNTLAFFTGLGLAMNLGSSSKANWILGALQCGKLREASELTRHQDVSGAALGTLPGIGPHLKFFSAFPHLCFTEEAWRGLINHMNNGEFVAALKASSIFGLHDQWLEITRRSHDQINVVEIYYLISKLEAQYTELGQLVAQENQSPQPQTGLTFEQATNQKIERIRRKLADLEREMNERFAE
jgi:hypothetical protein